jgi:hypothetical protein
MGVPTRIEAGVAHSSREERDTMKRALLLIAALLGLAVWTTLPDRATAQRNANQPDGVEVLTHGPVHESYAKPSDPQPRPKPVVPRQPPEPIPEVPPDYRPTSDDTVWIPGYWDWNDESQDFLWVSGIWREEPPDDRWVAGYWEQVQTGWVRVPGFWAPDDVSEFTYVPDPPPPPPEAVPPQPDETSLFVPGVWVWRETNFYWRPGF